MQIALSNKNEFDSLKKEIKEFISNIKNSKNISDLIDNIDLNRLSYQYSILHFLVKTFPKIFDYTDLFKSKTVQEFLKDYEKLTRRENFATETGWIYQSNLISELDNEIDDKLTLIWLQVSQYKTFNISIIETLKNDVNNYLLFPIQDTREQLLNQLTEIETLWSNKKFSECFIKSEAFVKISIKSIANKINLKVDKLNKKSNKDDYLKLLDEIFNSFSTNNDSIKNIFNLSNNIFQGILIATRNFFKPENYDKNETIKFHKKNIAEQELICRIYIDLCKLLSNTLLIISKNNIQLNNVK